MTADRGRESGRRMPRWSPPRLAPFLLTVSVGLWFPPSVNAKVYECQDQAGDRVYTDDPRAFVNCHALAIDSAPPTPQPARPSEQPPPPSKEALGKTPDQSPAVVQPAPPDSAVSRPDPALTPDPEYAPLPRVVQPQTQTCAKDINRLNPFGSAPCQPSPGSAPMSVPYEDYYR